MRGQGDFRTSARYEEPRLAVHVAIRFRTLDRELEMLGWCRQGDGAAGRSLAEAVDHYGRLVLQ